MCKSVCISLAWRSTEDHTSRHDGPDIRTMAIPALPSAVDTAYIVSSSCVTGSYAAEWNFDCSTCREEVLASLETRLGRAIGLLMVHIGCPD